MYVKNSLALICLHRQIFNLLVGEWEGGVGVPVNNIIKNDWDKIVLNNINLLVKLLAQRHFDFVST